MLRRLRSADEDRFDAHVREVKARLAALDEAFRAPAAPTAERDAALMDVVGRMDALHGQMSALERRAAQVGPREEAIADGLREIRTMLEGAFAGFLRQFWRQ